MTDDPTTDVARPTPDERSTSTSPSCSRSPPLDDVDAPPRSPSARRAGRLAARAPVATEPTPALDASPGAGPARTRRAATGSVAVAAGAVAVIAVGAGVIGALRDDGGGSGTTAVAGRGGGSRRTTPPRRSGGAGERPGRRPSRRAPDGDARQAARERDARRSDLGDLGDVGRHGPAACQPTPGVAPGGGDPPERSSRSETAGPPLYDRRGPRAPVRSPSAPVATRAHRSSCSSWRRISTACRRAASSTRPPARCESEDQRCSPPGRASQAPGSPATLGPHFRRPADGRCCPP